MKARSKWHPEFPIVIALATMLLMFTMSVLPGAASSNGGGAEQQGDYSVDPLSTQRAHSSFGDLGASFQPLDSAFIDVPQSHWAHEYIEALYNAGYLAGCSASPPMYCPESTMTRAESAVFIERGIHDANYIPIEPDQQTFADVASFEWYFKWAEGLWADEYTAGCGTHPLLFCPLQGHSRAEAAVFFERMVHGKDFLPGEPYQQVYADVPIGAGAPWFSRWIYAAYDDQIVQACENDANRGDSTFRPEEGITRAEAACIMHAAKEIDLPTPTPPPSPTPTPNPAVFYSGFESGDYSDFKVQSCEAKGTCTTDSIEIVASPVRAGDSAVRFIQRESDPEVANGQRTELLLDNLPLDEACWFGHSFLVPSDWAYNGGTWPGAGVVIHQWHHEGGQPGSSPIFAFRITADVFKITQELDSGDAMLRWSAPIQKGRWVDLVWQINYSVSEAGLINVWMDGELIFEQTGRNLAHGTTVGPYEKFGMYSSMSVLQRTLYYDEFRYGCGAGIGYADVAPREG